MYAIRTKRKAYVMSTWKNNFGVRQIVSSMSTTRLHWKNSQHLLSASTCLQQCSLLPFPLIDKKMQSGPTSCQKWRIYSAQLVYPRLTWNSKRALWSWYYFSSGQCEWKDICGQVTRQNSITRCFTGLRWSRARIFLSTKDQVPLMVSKGQSHTNNTCN